MRPKLTLKKPVKNTEITIPTPDVPKVTKEPKPIESRKSSQQDTKKIQSQLNANKNEEVRLRNRAYVEKINPIVITYFAKSTIFSDTVIVDDVECLRPLRIGVAKSVYATLREHPDVKGCSKTLLEKMITGILKKHVSSTKYLNGILKFQDRYDLDGNTNGLIIEKHKKRAEKMLLKLQQDARA